MLLIKIQFQLFQSPHHQPIAEGDSGTTDYNIAVNLNYSTSEDVRVNFALGKAPTLDDDGMVIEAGDTATLNDDYTVGNAANSLTFPAGTTGPQNINIKVVGDLLNEANETFTVTLSLPSGTPLVTLPSDPTATGTITNDDTDQIPTISITNADALEGSGTNNGEIEFTVLLSAASGLPVTVNYATRAFPPAVPGSGDTLGRADSNDYEVVTDGTLIIPASSNSTFNTGGTFTITTTADDVQEPNDIFLVVLTLPANANAVLPVDPDNPPARLTEITARGTIVDDDALSNSYHC